MIISYFVVCYVTSKAEASNPYNIVLRRRIASRSKRDSGGRWGCPWGGGARGVPPARWRGRAAQKEFSHFTENIPLESETIG